MSEHISTIALIIMAASLFLTYVVKKPLMGYGLCIVWLLLIAARNALEHDYIFVAIDVVLIIGALAALMYMYRDEKSMCRKNINQTKSTNEQQELQRINH